jgi:hypothetical protein
MLIDEKKKQPLTINKNKTEKIKIKIKIKIFDLIIWVIYPIDFNDFVYQN